MTIKTTFLFVIFLMIASFSNGYAYDEIKLLPGCVPTDQRYNYPNSILKEALEATIDSDGPFKITFGSHAMARNRALPELITGEIVNVHVAATRDEWEKNTIPLRIPILKGLLGYRLLLVNKADLEKFKRIHDIESLKQLKAGSGNQISVSILMQFRPLFFAK